MKPSERIRELTCNCSGDTAACILDYLDELVPTLRRKQDVDWSEPLGCGGKTPIASAYGIGDDMIDGVLRQLAHYLHRGA